MRRWEVKPNGAWPSMKKEKPKTVFDKKLNRWRCSECGKLVRNPDPRRPLPGNTNYHYHNPVSHIYPNTRGKQ